VVGRAKPRGFPFEEPLEPTCRTDVAIGAAFSYSVSLDFRVSNLERLAPYWLALPP
jgi:hypothetical protein